MAKIAGQLNTGASKGHCPHLWLLHNYYAYTSLQGGTFDVGQNEHHSLGEGDLHLQTIIPGITEAIKVKYMPTISGTLISAGAHTKANSHSYYGYVIDTNDNTG